MEIEAHQIYQSMMLEIKVRIRAMDNRIESDGGKMSNLDIELCFLQARKIIEQICFSSILCDKNRYKDFRRLEGETAEKEHGNYVKDWKSPIILKKLKDISPHFMPRSLGEKTEKNGTHHFNVGLQTTHSELIAMWEHCGYFMHIPKPFGEGYVSHIEKVRDKYKQACQTVKEYSQYFKKLLWHHAAIGLVYEETTDPLSSLEPANPSTAWLVDFGDYESDAISITIAVAD